MPDAMETKVVRGVTLRKDPAREACFTVVEVPSDLHDYDDMSDVARRQRLHRHMHNEMQTLEIAALSLAEFRDAPWELRLELARQCWDETRHTLLLYRRLLDIGGHKGEFPVMNYEWSVSCMVDSLPARLALQNRTFEGGELDLLRQLADRWRESGDETTAGILDAILSDEIRHVGFANRWFKQMARDEPKVLLQLASAINFLKRVTEAMSPDEGEVNAVGVQLDGFTHAQVLTNVEDRLRAGFTEEEVAGAQDRERRSAAQRAP
jgi:uncharacterized ferritin-like protein (DUF455 family)